MSEETFRKRYYRLPRREIGYLRFILESYDGLAFMRTIDAGNGLVEIAWPPARTVDVEPLLAALEGEAGMVEVPAPAVVEPL